MNYFAQHKEAFIGTAIFIAAVLLFLLLCGLKMPDPPLVEESIILDFTTPTEEITLHDRVGGGGNPNAGASTASASTSTQNTSTQNSNSNSNTNSNPSVESQAFEEAATLPSGNDSKGEETKEPAPAPVSKAEGKLNFGGLANGKGSGNSGSGTGGGNPGFGGGNGSGGGSGNGPGGVGGSLGNRKVTKKDPEQREGMFGTVKLKITVNEKGKVETAEPTTGTTCQECVPFARKAVMQWQYEPKPGSGTQTGIVIVEFKQK